MYVSPCFSVLGVPLGPFRARAFTQRLKPVLTSSLFLLDVNPILQVKENERLQLSEFICYFGNVTNVLRHPLTFTLSE